MTRLKTPIPSKYFLHNTEFESVSAIKYLGVTIFEDLRWGQYIDNVTIKANQTLGFLKRFKVNSSRNIPPLSGILTLLQTYIKLDLLIGYVAVYGQGAPCRGFL